MTYLHDNFDVDLFLASNESEKIKEREKIKEKEKSKNV